MAAWRVRWIALAAALATPLCLPPSSARADHEIDRIEGNWEASSGGYPRVATRTGRNPDTFEGVSVQHPNPCIRPGEVVARWRGHEPSYAWDQRFAFQDPADDTCKYAWGSGKAWIVQKPNVLELHGCALNPFNNRESCGFVKRTRVDTDGDALMDDEELSGLNPDEDPEIEADLRAMGADPKRRDVFVEVDYMTTHQLDPAAIEATHDAFLSAPVTNPDGSSGISLHVDGGPGTEMNPLTGEAWGPRSRANEIGHQLVFGALDQGHYDWSAFQLVKAESLEPARRGAFHYAIAAHEHANKSAAGESLGIPGSDFVMAFAECGDRPVDCQYDAEAQGMVFMHELGHNLGLMHGGESSDPNFEPNHFSIMNYNFGYGIPRRSGGLVQDYSRYNAATVFDLQESSLEESSGVRAAGTPQFETFYYCRKRGDLEDDRRRVGINEPADFDCDGNRRESRVTTSINKDGDRGCAAGSLDSCEALGTVNEWERLVFDGGDLGGGATPPGDAALRTPIIDTEEQDDTREALVGDFKRPKLRVKRKAAGKRVKIRIVARDEKELTGLFVRRKGEPLQGQRERLPDGRRATITARVSKSATLHAAALDAAGHVAYARAKARR